MNKIEVLGCIALLSLGFIGVFAGWFLRSVFNHVPIFDNYIIYFLVSAIAVFILTIVILQYNYIMETKEDRERKKFEVEEG